MSLLKTVAFAAALACASPTVASETADAAGASRLAFFGFSLINTSLETVTTEEDRRIRLLDDLFRDKVAASGRYALVPIPAEMRAAIGAGPEIGSCNGCELDYAKAVGAEAAAWGTVQKVSNLILNINLYIKDATTGELQFIHSVDIRGNTDESWSHGLNYMLRHYLLGEP